MILSLFLGKTVPVDLVCILRCPASNLLDASFQCWSMGKKVFWATGESLASMLWVASRQTLKQGRAHSTYPCLYPAGVRDWITITWLQSGNNIIVWVELTSQQHRQGWRKQKNKSSQMRRNSINFMKQLWQILHLWLLVNIALSAIN